jgi:hypothetical protein
MCFSGSQSPLWRCLVQSSALLDMEYSLEVETRPRPDSYDSGHECSLGHLLEVYRLVEIEDHELDKYMFDDTCLRVD